MKQAERYTTEGLHPRLIADGYEVAKEMTLEFLEGFKVAQPGAYRDRELLTNVARTSLRTKLPVETADRMSDAIVDAMIAISEEDQPVDLHMVEVMQMQHKAGSDSCFINGIVLDHGSRHPDMPTQLENVRILTCNVSMEYEKTEISAGFFYSSAEEREKLVESERRFTDEKVRLVIDFKRRVCKEGESFAILNQKGIDPVALDMMAKEGIFAVRRAKRRNMVRLAHSVYFVFHSTFSTYPSSSPTPLILLLFFVSPSTHNLSKLERIILASYFMLLRILILFKMSI